MTKLDKLAYDLGPLRETQKFLFEAPIAPDGIEVGCDTFFFKGYPAQFMYGFEAKNEGYVCRFMSPKQAPPRVREINSALEPWFIKQGVQGMMSSEIRDDGKKGYFTDACMRGGLPPSGIIGRGYKNLADIFLGIAEGEEVKPEPVAEYAAEVIVGSGEPDYAWLPLQLHDKDLDRISPRNLCKIGDTFYRIPTDKEVLVAECVGFGASVEEAQYEAMESVELLDCAGKTFVKDVFEQLDETLERADKLGVGFGK
jgi:hypothetical protein